MPSSPTKVILGARRSHCTFSHLLEDEKGINDLPLEVECICIVCLGNSKYGTIDCTIVINQHPRWTETTPPKYVEKRLRCNNCGTSRRFIPVNADLESLPVMTIETFHRGNHGLSEDNQLLMLQKLPSAARNHRWQAPKGQQERTNKVNKYRDLMPIYLESREGAKVHTMCSSCGRREIDMKPQWLKGTDTYYARAIWVCSTAECMTTKMNMIPVDKSINYVKHRHLIVRMREDMSRKEVIDRRMSLTG